MPGIFGLADGANGVDAGGLLRAMAATMRHDSSYKDEFYEDGTLVMGRQSLAFQHPGLAKDANRAVAVDGEVYDSQGNRLALRNADWASPIDNLGELFVAGYAAKSNAFLRSLNGKFAAAIYDRQRQHLILVNDRFGMRPLYYVHLPGRLLFASEIKALLTDPHVSRQRSLRGIAQFFTFGQLLGEDTLLDRIRLLPAAGILTYDVRQDHLTVDRYWRLTAEATAASGEGNGSILERIDHAFATAVGRCTQGATNLGLSLSGGLDARTILGAMDDEQSLTTVCLGVPGSADLQCAAEMARSTNRSHHECLLGAGFLDRFEEHLRHMVQLTDGHYLSQCIVMPTLPLYRKLGIQVLLRGHAGELMHMRKAYNFSLDSEALSLRNETSLEGWLFRHLQAYLLEGTHGRLFAAPLRPHIEGLARESLRDCLGESDGMQPLIHRVWHLFLSQRSRRETAMSLVKFGSQVETRLPYLDNELVDALFAAPPEMKLDETIQAYILRRRRPSFLKIRNVNTGATMDAGKYGKFFGKVRQKILAKLEVRGYQPYERLGLWLRRELRPLVERLLLCDQCLERGVFDPSTLRDVVGNHFRGQNHTFLIMALMTFEMGQREFIDNHPSASAIPFAAPAHSLPPPAISLN